VFCRTELARLAKLHPRLLERGAQLVVLTLGNPTETRVFCRARAPGVACFSDPTTGDAYRKYGLQRGTAGQLFGPAVWLEGARASVEGRYEGAPIGKPVGDPFMMPGIFVIETDGRLSFCHYSKHAGDYPSDTALIEAAVGAL
jgi:AhpC/TSA antioxidant enzyme